MPVTRPILDVQRAVRVVLDQNKITDQLIAVGDVDTLAIDDMIRDAIPRAIRAILLVAPGVMIDDAVNGIDDLQNTNLSATIAAQQNVALYKVSGSGNDRNKGTAISGNFALSAGTKVALDTKAAALGNVSAGKVIIDGFTIPAGTVVWDKSYAVPVQKTFEEDVIGCAAGAGDGDKVLGVLYSSGGGVAATIKSDAQGVFYASIDLPSNFLRLLSLQMSDWDYAIDHATPRGDSTYAIQHSNVYSLRGNPHRPIAVVTPDGKSLEAFGCLSGDATMTSFNYVAIPEIDTANDTINISDKLYPSVIYYCASLVCTSLGDFNKAHALERIAMQYVTINTNTNREIQSE